MQTKKEYLTKIGLISGKAGRWPVAAHEAIAAAEAKGMKFADYSPEEIAAQKAKAERAVARAKAAAEKAKAQEAEKAERAKAREAAKEAKALEKPKSKASDVVDAPDPRPDRPNGYYTFRNPDRTTFQRLHTAACARCSYSLQWCYCTEGPVLFAHPYRSDGAYARLAKIPARSLIKTTEVPEKQPTRGGTRRGGSRPGRRRRAA